MELSPIVIFGFNRPAHMNRMLNSLKKNKEAFNSSVIFYIDGYDGKNDSKINETLDVVNKNWGFKTKEVNFRSRNYGCKFNIIEGISEVFKNHQSAIILEDDLILSEYFLEFMNNSLQKYKKVKKVWSISGWGHPQLMNRKKGASFSTLTSPWGWGTWKENWEIFNTGKYYEKNLIPNFNSSERNEFLFYGFANYWEDAIKKDFVNENSVWDAYWYQTIFINKGLTLFPNMSHVQNEGFVGSGLHCKENDLFYTKLNSKSTSIFPTRMKIDGLYRINTILFFTNYRRKQYFDYHREKFSSPRNFLNFLVNKLRNFYS